MWGIFTAYDSPRLKLVAGQLAAGIIRSCISASRTPADICRTTISTVLPASANARCAGWRRRNVAVASSTRSDRSGLRRHRVTVQPLPTSSFPHSSVVSARSAGLVQSGRSDLPRAWTAKWTCSRSTPQARFRMPSGGSTTAILPRKSCCALWRSSLLRRLRRWRWRLARFLTKSLNILKPLALPMVTPSGAPRRLRPLLDRTWRAEPCVESVSA